MRMSEVDDLLAKKPQGFRVAFEKRERGMLGSDYFPERDEPLIQIEAEAWEWAGRFAAKAPPECRAGQAQCAADGFWREQIAAMRAVTYLTRFRE